MELLRVSPRNPRAWKEAVDALETFLSEGVFHFTESGVWLQALDPSRVVFISMEAPTSVFSTYALHHPEVRVPLSITDYQKVLSRLSPGDTLTMSFSSTNLYIVMEGSGVKKEFVLPAIDVKESITPINMPDSVSRVTIPASHLRDALRNASIVSSHVVFHAERETFSIEAREGSNVSRTIFSSSHDVSISSDAPSTATYTIAYLQNILKGAEGEVALEFANDSTLKVFYTIDGIRMTYVLAPLFL